MTLQKAIIAARKRVLRPEGYQQVAGAVLAFLVILVAVRLGANIYIGHLLLVLNPSDGATVSERSVDKALAHFFARTNLSWCAFFMASAAPIIAYRGVAQTVRNPRLRLAPLSSGRLFVASAGASLRSVPVILPTGLSVAIGALYLRTPVIEGMVEVALFLLVGIGGFIALHAIAWRLRAEGRRLELIEIGIFVAMILANPEFRVVGGQPRLLLFNSTKVALTQPALLLMLPFLGMVITAAALFVSERLAGTRPKRPSRPRAAGMVLYRSHIPLRLFVLTYAVEIPIILANPAVATTVRNTVLVMLTVRIFWFLLFVFRTEQEIGRLLAPPWKFSDRVPLYRSAACLHGLLCMAPLLLYLARIVVS